MDTKSDNKAAIVERFNRTLKERMERYFTFSGKKQYVNVLQDLVNSYNRSIHSAIKMPPIKVTKSTEAIVRETLYGGDEMQLENDYSVKFAFKVGDYVRLAVDKSIFEKGYMANWSQEIYIVYFLNPTNPPNYKIKTLDGIEYDKNYYKEQLQLVPDKDFPYNSYEILEQEKDKILVRKLNSETQDTKWVKRVQPSRKSKNVLDIATRFKRKF